MKLLFDFCEGQSVADLFFYIAGRGVEFSRSNRIVSIQKDYETLLPAQSRDQ
jgi:hypothetical protein